MRRGILALAGCVVALLTLPAVGRAACPDVKPNDLSSCGPLFTLPQWVDASGWDKPSSYETIQTANLDGKPGAELLGRSPVGLWVERYDSAAGQWALAGTAEGGVALPLPDSEGWAQPNSYLTLQTGDLDGDGAAELLLRGKEGLQVYAWDDAAATFSPLAASPLLVADEPGGQPNLSIAETIQTADVDGDRKAELLVRMRDGLRTYRWNASAKGFEQVGATLTALADANEGYWPGFYQTIQTADVDGDGRVELLSRLADGLHTWRWADGWTEAGAVLTNLSDQFFDKPQYWQTVQTGDVDGNGGAELLARGAGGLHTFRWAAGWQEAGPTLAALSDSQGYDKPDRYRTIQTGDLDGDRKVELIARVAAGIDVYRREGSGWTKLASATPALADDPWAEAQHYATIQTGDTDGDGHAELLGRGSFGMRTFAWDEARKAFRRPRPYGDFPAFTGEAERAAYAALGQFLLGRAAEFRHATYAGPAETITEATLDRYRGRLTERCDVTTLQAAGARPPLYADCTPPPGSGVDTTAWTTVTNQIVAELYAAAGVVAHFTSLDTILTKLYQDQQGTLPALDAELKLPVDAPDRAPTFLNLIRSGLDVLGSIAQLTPIGEKYKQAVRAVALTSAALGAIIAGLGLKKTPDPAQTYAKITSEVAKMQQRQRDVTEAQRRYVLADYGLLRTVGGLVNGRLLTLDTTAMLSAGRQGFAKWVYQLYTPAFWTRYQVRGCRDPICEPPSVPAMKNLNPAGTDFTAILGNRSTCTDYGLFVDCNWLPLGAVGDALFGKVSEECVYDPTPGSTAAWRYGCNLGTDPRTVLDLKDGWSYPTTECRVRLFKMPASCKAIASTTLDTASATVDNTGAADLHLVGTVRFPGNAPPTRLSVHLEHVLHEEDGAGELVEDPGGASLAPLDLPREGGGASGHAVFGNARRPREPRVAVRMLPRGGQLMRKLRVVMNVHDARLEPAHACLEGARSVRLETRVELREGRRRLSYPIRARWGCAEGGRVLRLASDR